MDPHGLPALGFIWSKRLFYGCSVSTDQHLRCITLRFRVWYFFVSGAHPAMPEKSQNYFVRLFTLLVVWAQFGIDIHAARTCLVFSRHFNTNTPIYKLLWICRHIWTEKHTSTPLLTSACCEAAPKPSHIRCKFFIENKLQENAFVICVNVSSHLNWQTNSSKPELNTASPQLWLYWGWNMQNLGSGE